VFVLAARRRRNSQPGRLRYEVHGGGQVFQLPDCAEFFGIEWIEKDLS